jgi:hypothetical protein
VKVEENSYRQVGPKVNVQDDEPYAKEEEGGESSSGFEHEIPASIDAIIGHMDELEPGARYHARQADNRGGKR